MSCSISTASAAICCWVEMASTGFICALLPIPSSVAIASPGPQISACQQPLHRWIRLLTFSSSIVQIQAASLFRSSTSTSGSTRFCSMGRFPRGPGRRLSSSFRTTISSSMLLPALPKLSSLSSLCRVRRSCLISLQCSMILMLIGSNWCCWKARPGCEPRERNFGRLCQQS